MSEQSRRRLRPAAAPRRVGEPNVLSDQAIPNRLSTATIPGSARGATPPTMAPTESSTRPIPTRPTVAAGRPVEAPTDGTGPPRRRQLPSLSTLIFIGFLVFTAARFISNMGAGEASPTTAPQAGPDSPGLVTFGRSLDDACDLSEAAGEFKAGEEVWWRAELSREQVADATVVVRAYHDEGQIERFEVPPEPGLGTWDVLCAGEPVNGKQSGSYRVEVWDETEKKLLAVGTYTKIAGTP